MPPFTMDRLSGGVGKATSDWRMPVQGEFGVKRNELIVALYLPNRRITGRGDCLKCESKAYGEKGYF